MYELDSILILMWTYLLDDSSWPCFFVNEGELPLGKIGEEAKREPSRGKDALIASMNSH